MSRIERLEAGVVANRDPTGPMTRPVLVDPNTGRAKLGGRATPLVVVPNTAPVVSAITSTSKPASEQPSALASEPYVAANQKLEPTAVLSDDEVKRRWPDVVAAQKPMVRALFSAMNIVDCRDGIITLSAPSDMHITKSNDHLEAISSSLKVAAGKLINFKFVVGESKRNRNIKQNSPDLIDEEIEEPVDLSETTKVPKGTRSSPIDEFAKAFPGSRIIDDKK